MSEEYVRKEVFDEVVKRLEARFDGLQDVTVIAINDLKERIDDMKHSQSQSITRWAILIAVLICAVQVCLTLYLR